MADSKFSYVRALVQDGSLTNLATASPWTVTHSGGSGLTLTTASRIIAESDPIGRAATLCAEAVVSLDTAFAGSTVLSAGLASIAMNSDGQLGCMLDGIQVDVLNIPLASQRVLCAIEYGVDGANENYFFRATGETSGGTVSTTAVASALTYPGNATSKTVVGGLLGDTVQASPAQGTVNVSTTRPGVASTAVPHIVAIEPAINLLDGRTAPSTGGTVTVTAERGSSSVTYTIPNTAGMSINSLGAALAAGIASQIGGTASTSGGKTYITTATNEDNQNWFIWFNALGLSYPAEPPVWGPSVAGGSVFSQRITQSGVYGAPGGSVTQRNVTSLTLPVANANMNLAVSLQPTLNATANMGVVAAGLDSLVAQIAAVGFTASWQQIGAGQYIINTERLTPGAFALTANLTVSAGSVSNPVTTLHAMRVTTAARYTAVGGVPDEFPTLPWPTTSIPPGGGGGGTTLPADVWLALNFENGFQDLSSYAHTLALNSQVIASPPGQNPSRTGDTYVYASTTTSALNYNANLNELNGLTVLTIEFDIFVPNTAGQAYFFGATGGVYSAAMANGATAGIATYGFIPPLASQLVTVTTNVWHHVAFVGGALECRIYVDGLLQITAAGQPLGVLDYSANLPTPTPLGILNIASPPDTYPTLAGLSLDNVLITKREKYNANFTPPGAIVGPTPISASPLYLKFEDGAGNATALNQGTSSGSFPVTPHAIVSSQHSDGAGSLQLTGVSGDSMGFSSIAGPGTGNYTAEMWVRFPSLPPAFAMFAGNYVTGGFFVVGDGRVGWVGSGSTQETPNGSVVANTWYHIAAVNQSGTVRFYLDGVQPSGNAGSGTIQPVPYPYALGEDATYGISAAAFVDEYRFTNSALYTSNFTPASPLDVSPPSGVDVTAAGYHDIDDITGSGTFNTQLTAPEAYFFSSATLDDSVSTGDAYTVDGNSINFTGPRTLANTTCTGTFVYGTPQNFDSDVTLDDNTAVSTFYADTPKEWTGESTLDNVTSFGLMMFLAPAMFSGESVADEVTASGSFSMIDPVVWRVNATVPAATLAARINQFFVNATVPPAELVASISAYEGFRLDATVPSATVSAWTGISLNAEVPRVTLSASATVPNTLRLDSQLPRIVSQANLLTGRSLAVNATLPAATLSAWTGLQLQAIVPVATVSGQAVTGGAYRLDAAVPAATAQIGVSSMNVLRLDSAVPAAARSNWLAVSGTVPAATAFARIEPVVGIARLAYSFTLANSAMTRYPAYPFIQVFRMGNAYYGVAEDGLYELGGITDNGVSIPWSWETCMADFGQAEKKTVVSAYLGGYVPQNMTYTIKAGDVPTGTNAHTTTATAVLRNHRQKFGIGRKSRFFAFGLSATQGRVAIESIEFEMATMSRRV